MVFSWSRKDRAPKTVRYKRNPILELTTSFEELQYESALPMLQRQL
jgi:hypothetical protein